MSFEGRTVILAASLKNKPITEAYFPSATHVVSVLQESGVTNFGQLPDDLSVLAGKNGIDHSLLALFFNDLMNLHTKELTVGPIRALSPDRYFQPFYREFEEWVQNERDSEGSGQVSRAYLEFLVTEFATGLATEIRSEQVVLEAGDKLLDDQFSDMFNAFAFTNQYQRGVTKLPVETNSFPGFVFERFLRKRGYHLFMSSGVTYATKLDPKLIKERDQAVVLHFREAFKLKGFTLDELTQFCAIQAVEKNRSFGYVYSLLIDEMKPASDLIQQKAVELVIREYKDGVIIADHHDEMCDKVNACLPQGMDPVHDLSDYVFTAYLEKRLLLWGPGAYIHCEHLSVAPELLKEAAQHAEMIVDDEWYVSIPELYERFKDKAEQQKIPTIEAFYSVLMTHLSEDYVYPIYPIMHSRGTDFEELLLEELRGI